MPTPLEEMNSTQKIGRLIRQHRTSRKMSQAELALKAGTTQAAIARIEAGITNPTLTTLEEMSRALHLKLDIAFTRRYVKRDKVC